MILALILAPIGSLVVGALGYRTYVKRSIRAQVRMTLDEIQREISNKRSKN